MVIIKKKIAVLTLLLLVISLSLWSYNKYFKAKPQVLELSGTIEATEINLSSKLPGILEFVAVNSGEQVKNGQLIAGITRNDLSIQRESSALSVQKAQAILNDLASGARQEEIKEAQVLVTNAQISLDDATADYNRIDALYQSGAISQKELEKATTNLEKSKNQLEAATAKLNLLLSGARPEQLNAAKIEVEKSRANLSASKVALDDAKIISSINGTVISRNYEPGEYIGIGSPVVTVADLENLWIKVFISTDDLPKIKLGQPVTFSVSGVSEEFPGTIREIATKGEFTPKTIQTKQERTNIVFAVKIEIDNSKGMFKPGMPADVVIVPLP